MKADARTQKEREFRINKIYELQKIIDNNWLINREDKKYLTNKCRESFNNYTC
jgi:hypothetical protein